MALPDHQREVLVRVAVQLLQYQSAERLLRLCAQVVLPEEPIRTLDQLQSLEERERTKTIGYFLARLRERAELAPEFDAALSIFLRDRNAFIHDLTTFEDWSPRTVDGCRACTELLERLDKQTTVVLDVFTGLLRAWEIQSGRPTALPGHEAEFERIDRDLVPLVQHVFGKKPA